LTSELGDMMSTDQQSVV